MWGAGSFSWVGMRANGWYRAGLMALMLIGSAVIYFAALWVSGVKLRQFVTR